MNYKQIGLTFAIRWKKTAVAVTTLCHPCPWIMIDIFFSICQELNEIEEFGMLVLAQKAADLLSDKLPETREAVRSMVSSVYEKIIWNGDEKDKQEACQKFCEKNVTGPNAQALIKIVSSLWISKEELLFSGTHVESFYFPYSYWLCPLNYNVYTIVHQRLIDSSSSTKIVVVAWLLLLLPLSSTSIISRLSSFSISQVMLFLLHQ